MNFLVLVFVCLIWYFILLWYWWMGYFFFVFLLEGDFLKLLLGVCFFFMVGSFGSFMWWVYCGGGWCSCFDCLWYIFIVFFLICWFLNMLILFCENVFLGNFCEIKLFICIDGNCMSFLFRGIIWVCVWRVGWCGIRSDVEYFIGGNCVFIIIVDIRLFSE